MLRWRLLVGLVSIFVLLLAVGGYSIWLTSRLETDINSILKDNYESIREAHNIRLSVLRLNAAYFKPDVAKVVAVGAAPLEDRYLPPLESTIAALVMLARTPTDKANARKLAGQVGDYIDHMRQVIFLPPDAQERYNALRSQMLEKNLALTATTEDILASNEAAMLRAQEHARVAARDTVQFLVGAMLVAAAVFVYTFYRMGRSIISPIEDLTRSIEAVRAGQFEHNLPVRSNDELSRLASAFNAMAGELRTRRRDTDETILRLNRSLRETIAAFPYPVLLLDANFAIWVTNEAADDFLESIGEADQLPAPIQQHLDEVRRTRENYLPEGPRESLLFRIGEREVHYLPRILRIFTPEGDFAGAAVILIDVSRFRWLDEMKTNLISTISHEIKTPLTGIRMILHLLLEKSGGDLTPMQLEMVQAACDDCERLLATLNGLLDLSRMEAGRTQLDLKPTPPRDLLERTRAAFQTQADGRHVALAIEADEALPPVLADGDRILHTLGNFTSNALKFAPANSTVHLTADKVTPGFVRFSVIDSGPGIPEQYHASIFDKFFRTPNHHVDGVGLGLSIAREIVQAHDGRIGVQSIPHTSTRFYCELPTT
jgi:signal transduction histidine kinase/HAMP domain-containing protein